MRIDGDGDEDNGSEIDFGFDDGGLDLSFGEDTSDPADLNLEDMSGGTDGPKTVTTDLSGAPAPKTPAGAPDPKATPPATTTKTPPAQQTPAPAQTAPQQPAATEQPGATEQPQQTVNIEDFVAENHEAIIGNLATSHFKIDDATATALGFTPEVREFVEKRDAKNFLLTMVQVNNALQRTLPAVVANLVQLTGAAKETEDGFFTEFPDLKGKADVKFLKGLAQTLRSANPQMEKAQFQTLLGNTAMLAMGIQPTTRQAPARQQQAGRVVRRGNPQPFIPAGSTVPQRNQGGNGAGQLSGLEFMSHALRTGMDE